MTDFTLLTTPECIRAQFLMFALEEGCLPYRTEIRPPSFFGKDQLMVGPLLIAEGSPLKELNVALRSIGCATRGLIPDDHDEAIEMETWLEHQATWLRPSGVRIYHAKREGRMDGDAEKMFVRSIRRMNRTLETREYLAGAFSLADCTAPFLFGMKLAGIDLPEAPALAAYLERLCLRPGFARANERWLALGRATTESQPECSGSTRCAG